MWRVDPDYTLMTIVPANAFLSWAASRGIVPDDRYDPPRCLVFQGGRADSRFWALPRRSNEIRAFLSHLLAGLSPWDHCHVWPRCEYWHNSDSPRNRIEEVRTIALYGGQVPEGMHASLCYSASETEHLLNLLVARSQVAVCAWDDLFVIPEHAGTVLWFDHHGVVHVELADASRLEPFVGHMASGGYVLPDEPPDQTFKPAGWMS